MLYYGYVYRAKYVRVILRCFTVVYKYKKLEQILSVYYIFEKHKNVEAVPSSCVWCQLQSLKMKECIGIPLADMIQTTWHSSAVLLEGLRWTSKSTWGKWRLCRKFCEEIYLCNVHISNYTGTSFNISMLINDLQKLRKRFRNFISVGHE